MYQYLNHDNLWPRVRRFGLELDPEWRSLSLGRLPGPPRPIARAPGTPGRRIERSGIAVGADGSIYISDPTRHQVYRIDPTQGTVATLGCLGATDRPDTGVGRLNTPRGLAYQAC